MARDASIRKTLVRKAIHSLGALILLIQLLYGVKIAQLVIVVMIMLYLVSETLRLSGKRLPLFALVTHMGSTEEERMGVVTAPIWFGVGILITITLFSLDLATIGVITLTIGDSIAAITGQVTKNRHPIPFNNKKSVEGTLVGYVVSMLICSVLIDPFPSIFGCAAGMVVEALPLRINDNLSIPIVSSFTALITKILMGNSTSNIHAMKITLSNLINQDSLLRLHERESDSFRLWHSL